MPNWKKLIVSGSDALLNSLTVSTTGRFDDDLTVSGSNSSLILKGDGNKFARLTHDGSGLVIDGGVQNQFISLGSPTWNWPNGVRVYGDLQLTGSAGSTATFEGSTQSTVNLKTTTNSKNNYIVGTTAGAISFRPDGTESVFLKSGGNVGLGTSTPGEKLTVQDGAVISTDSSGVNYAKLDRFGGLTMKGNGAGSRGIQTPNTDALTFGTNGTERLRITSGGDVGVGTTAPVRTFHVEKATTYPGRFSYNSTNYLDIGYDSLNVKGGSLLFRNDGTEHLRINTTGALKAALYGSGNFTGTLAYTLGVDSSGNIIEFTGGTGGGTVSSITDGADTRVAYFNGTDSLEGSANFTWDDSQLTVVGDVEAEEFIGDLRGASLFKAQAGEALSKGDVVYISGISGNTTIVSKADADDANKMPAFGVAAAAASLNNPVDIYTSGILTGLDTSGFSVGDELFVSSSAGELTSTKPTGESSLLQKIAKVTRVDNAAGSIFITGAGRTNAVPNLNTGRLFVGNASNQAVADGTVHVDIANSKVGIGTTSPDSKLDVVGNIRLNTIGNELQFSNHNVGAYRDGSNRLVLAGYGGIHFRASNTSGMENQSLLLRLNTDGSLVSNNLNSYQYNVGTNQNFSFGYGSSSRSSAMSLNSYLWHDLLGFDYNYTRTQEVSTDGTNFSAESLQENLFAQKQDQSVEVIGSNEVAVRWTFQGVAWSVPDWMNIAFSYVSNDISKDILIESSTNGTTWTTRHTSTVSAGISTKTCYISNFGGDNYLRLTISKNNTASTNVVRISSIRLMTARAGDQGQGMEYQFPYTWDYGRRIAIGHSPTTGTYEASLAIKGKTADGTASSIIVRNSSNTSLFSVRNDGRVDIPNGALVQSGGGYANTSTNNSYFTGNLGIGTTSPSFRLHVDGGSAMFDTDTGNNPFYIARNSSTSEALKIYVNDTEAFFESIQDETGGDHGRFAFKMDGDSPNAYTRWLHGSTERMRLTANGRLGIGNTVPLHPLHVNGVISGSDTYINDWGSVSASLSTLTDNQTFNSAGTANYVAKFESADTITNSIIRDDGSTVGIGTAPGSKKLTVNGTGQFTGELFFSHFDQVGSSASRFRDDTILRFGTNRRFGIRYNSSDDEMQFVSSSNSLVRLDGDGNLTVTGTLTAQEFHTEFVSASIIYDSGSTKFGDTSDDNHDFTGSVSIASGSLQVWQSTSSKYLNIFGGSSGNFIDSYGADLYLRADGNSNNSLIVFNSGNVRAHRNFYVDENVGIGTTSPGTKLHVSGSGEVIKLQGATGQSYMTFFQGTGGRVGYIGTAGTTGMILESADQLNLYSGGNSTMYLDSSSNVSIGTTSAFTTGGTAKLTVAGNIISFGASNSDMAYFRRLSTGNFQWQTYNNGNSGNIHLQPYGGSVGIGTTSPDETLHVSGNTKTTNLYVAGDIIHTGDTDTKIQFNTDIINFDTAGSERLRIDAGGNIGIGTATPGAKLEVAGDTKLNGDLDFSGGTAKKIKTGSQRAYTLPAQGTRMRLLTVETGTSCRVYLDSSENGYNQPIVLEIFYKAQATTSKPQIRRLDNYQWHAHSNDIIFTSDAAGTVGADSHIYAEKVNHTTGRSVNIRKVEEFKGSVTILDGSTTDTNGGTDETIKDAVFSDVSIDDWGSVSASLSAIQTAGGVNGTGAANKVAIWSDSDTLTSDDLYWDSSNNRLGIGVSPSQPLDVNGTALIRNTVYVGDNIQHWGDGGTGLYFGTDNLSLQNDGGNTRLYIKTGGNVGIGTTSPNDKLHIYSGSLRLEDGGTSITRLIPSANGGNSKLTVKGGNFYHYTSFETSWNDFEYAHLQSSYNGGDTNFYLRKSDTSGNVAANTKISTGTSYFNGSVGIGDSTPTRELTVNGDIGLKNSGRLYLWDSHNLNYIQYDKWTTSASAGMTITNQASTGNLSLQTNSTTRLFISASGDVGIGTTSPIGNLEINTATVRTGVNGGADELVIQNDGYSGITILSSTTTAGQIHFGDVNQTNTGMIQYFHSDNTMRFATGDATEKMRIDSSGNVGIGTTNLSRINSTSTFFQPDEDGRFLVMNHNSGSFIMLETNATGGGDQVGGIYFNKTGNQSDAHIHVAGIDAVLVDHATDALDGGELRFFTKIAGAGDTSHHMLLDAGGNLGIGQNIDPAQRLHVDGNIRVGDSSDAMYSNRFFGLSNAAVYLQSNSGYPIIFNAGASEKMRITNGGDVGIGTASPSFKLDVGGTSRIAGTIHMYGAVRNYSGDFSLQNGVQDADILFKVNDGGTTTTAMMVDGATSNVGIGTTSPTAKLDVQGRVDFANDLRLRGTDSAADQGVVRFFVDSSDKLHIDTANDGNNRFVIDNQGRVGIGLSGPSVDLHVDGFARLNGGLQLNTTNAQIYQIQNSGLRFGTNNTERMRILAGGNVGIGTTAPGASLHVASTTNDYVAKFSHTTATGYAPGSILLQAGQGTSRGQGLFHYNTEADESWFTGVPYNVTSTKWIVAHKSDTTFNPDVAQLSHAIFTIDSDTDRVGIGTSAPTAKLDVEGDVQIKSANISYQENTDVDSAASEMVASISATDYTAVFFDYVITKSTNARAGTVMAVINGTNVEYTDVSTKDIGSTTDVTLTVIVTGGNVQLMASTNSDDWSIKSLVRGI